MNESFRWIFACISISSGMMRPAYAASDSINVANAPSAPNGPASAHLSSDWRAANRCVPRR